MSPWGRESVGTVLFDSLLARQKEPSPLTHVPKGSFFRGNIGDFMICLPYKDLLDGELKWTNKG